MSLLSWTGITSSQKVLPTFPPQFHSTSHCPTRLTPPHPDHSPQPHDDHSTTLLSDQHSKFGISLIMAVIAALAGRYNPAVLMISATERLTVGKDVSPEFTGATTIPIAPIRHTSHDPQPTMLVVITHELIATTIHCVIHDTEQTQTTCKQHVHLMLAIGCLQQHCLGFQTKR